MDEGWIENEVEEESKSEKEREKKRLKMWVWFGLLLGLFRVFFFFAEDREALIGR